MARRIGKKNSISINPLDYNITLLGESGIGKTTISMQVCEKLVGEDGYIHFDIGREAGALAIEGIMSEHIKDFTELREAVDEIIEYRDSDYKDLKVIMFDTLDELILLAEAESLRLYNKKSDKKADTIDGAWGGFQKGQAKAMEMILDIISDLRDVGISSFIIGHVKRSDIIDSITQETYSKLTADTTQKYFNAIKNKQHFVGLAYIDREIVKEKTGRKDIVKKTDITINRAVSESRVISFRDDTYSIDSKSRFANIIDKIPFNADDFIKAMTDAIMAEKTKNGTSVEEAKKEQMKREEIKEENAIAKAKSKTENKIDTDRNEELKNTIQTKYHDMSATDREKFKEMMSELGIEGFKDVSNIPTKKLEMLARFGE